MFCIARNYKFTCNLGLIKSHWLTLSAVSAVNRNSFTAKLIGHFIGFIDIGCCGLVAEIYGLADRCVAVFLESHLHPNMPLGLNVVGTFEDLADFSWDSRVFLYAAGFGNLVLQFFGVKAVLLSCSLEDRIYC